MFLFVGIADLSKDRKRGGTDPSPSATKISPKEVFPANCCLFLDRDINFSFIVIAERKFDFRVGIICPLFDSRCHQATLRIEPKGKAKCFECFKSMNPYHRDAAEPSFRCTLIVHIHPQQLPIPITLLDIRATTREGIYASLRKRRGQSTTEWQQVTYLHNIIPFVANPKQLTADMPRLTVRRTSRYTTIGVKSGVAYNVERKTRFSICMDAIFFGSFIIGRCIRLSSEWFQSSL
jgi:hypothetical protein